ncbi:MAG: PilZ domain-containing protein [Nitrospiraceae bacterium]|nr:MAG: PilZ domain-containing protein [Nitrospiraceae bacterium]
MGEEKRKFRRYNVDDIHGNMLYSADVHIVNISIDGVLLETTRRLDINREYNLKIKYKESILDLKGVVVWSVLSRTDTRPSGENIPIYKTGMRFSHGFSDVTRDVMKFIDENKTETMEKRLVGVRFKVNQPDDATIDASCEYEVKKLSLSGMLIETDRLLDIDSRHDINISLNQREIAVIGRIVNCVEVMKEDLKKYEIGIEFMEITEEDKKRIINFLNSLDKQ